MNETNNLNEVIDETLETSFQINVESSDDGIIEIPEGEEAVLTSDEGEDGAEEIEEVEDAITEEDLEKIPDSEEVISEEVEDVPPLTEMEILRNSYPPYESGLTDEDKKDVETKLDFDHFPEKRYSEIYSMLSSYTREFGNLVTTAKNIISFKEIQKEMEKTLETSKAMMEYNTDEESRDAVARNTQDLENKLHNMDDELEEWNKDAAGFAETFNQNYEKLEYAISLLKAALELFGEKPNSTKFILNELLFLNAKRRETLEKMKDEIFVKYVNLESKRLDIIDDAIENATNMDYIFSKYDPERKSFKDFMKKFKKNQKNHPDGYDYLLTDINPIKGSKKNSTRRFAVPKEEIIAAEEIMKERYGCKEIDFIRFTIEFLIFSLKGGLSTGYSTFYSIFFRSMKDIYAETYDLQDPDLFLSNLDELFERFHKAFDIA